MPDVAKYDEMFMNMAFESSKMSTCRFFKVGCVLVRDYRIISMGRNGTPAGFINCCDKFLDTSNREEHHKWSQMFEEHGEMNCLLYAAKNGIKTDGGTIYITMTPCHPCLKHIITAGIKEVVYKNIYDKAGYTDETLTLIEKSKLIMRQL